MTDAIKDVTIVGGGDIGLMTAISLRELNPGLDIEVVDDFSDDVLEVGKSTYWSIRDVLHGDLDIDEKRFTHEVKPIWKATVYFRDWCGYPEFHHSFDVLQKFPSGDTPNAIEQYYYYYDEAYASPDRLTRGEEIVAQGKSPWYYSPKDGALKKYDNIAYHLDTERFNTLLREVCRERGVSLVNDEITGVDVDGDRIVRVRSKSQAYEADLFVDASGFNRILKGELDGDFRDFDMPLDSAFNGRVERSLSEVVPATVIESGDYGWFWHIDTYDNRDLGYVFASEYVSDEDALAEFMDHCPDALSEDEVARYSFTSGYFDRAWVGNLVTIGNAEGFVEPLESTGLTANAEAAVSLSKLLSAHGRIDHEGIRDKYNAWVRKLWESIYDFISVHYRYADGDNEFWDRMTSIEVSDRVEHLEREFDRNGFDDSIDQTVTAPELEDLIVFPPRNFYVLMRNMGVTSTFYEENDITVSESVKREVDEYYGKQHDEVDVYYTAREVYKGLLDL